MEIRMNLPLPSFRDIIGPLRRLLPEREEDASLRVCQHCGKALDKRKTWSSDICHRCLRDVKLFLRRSRGKRQRATAVLEDKRQVSMVRSEVAKAMAFQPNPYHNLLENEFFARNDKGKLEKLTLADVSHFTDFSPDFSLLIFSSADDLLKGMRLLGKAELPVKNIEVRAILVRDADVEDAKEILKEKKLRVAVRGLKPR